MLANTWLAFQYYQHMVKTNGIGTQNNISK